VGQAVPKAAGLGLELLAVEHHMAVGAQKAGAQNFRVEAKVGVVPMNNGENQLKSTRHIHFHPPLVCSHIHLLLANILMVAVDQNYFRSLLLLVFGHKCRPHPMHSLGEKERILLWHFGIQWLSRPEEQPAAGERHTRMRREEAEELGVGMALLMGRKLVKK
jgi:hypothetical protein